MKILKTNQDGLWYFTNMTFLVLTYFVVRILPLPFVLHLFSSTSELINCGESAYDNLSCIIQAAMSIPKKCQLGCLVMYPLQLYWFNNIFRRWLRMTMKKVVNEKLNNSSTTKACANADIVTVDKFQMSNILFRLI